MIEQINKAVEQFNKKLENIEKCPKHEYSYVGYFYGKNERGFLMKFTLQRCKCGKEIHNNTGIPMPKNRIAHKLYV